ncbi:uncharacterized protein LOC135137533 isoform X1 [Zophobas morio]|uniref:uncharacterized protein LOC135137533 isoform X1 n=2 Tax=Zophobas morio TaxID=2755281 RepID=UPI003082A3AD
MVESSNEENPTTNKGVNVHSESLPARVHTYSETESTASSQNGTGRSTTDIRNEIQNVLDLMGPSTPSVITSCITSSDAENEDSIISKESMKTQNSSLNRDRKNRSTLKFINSVASSDITRCSLSFLDEKKSMPTNESETKDSVKADAGTISTNNFLNYDELEPSCCDHERVLVSPECLCAILEMNKSQAPVTPPRIYEGTRSTCKSTRFAPVDYKKRSFFEWVKEKSSDLKLKKSYSTPCELYRVNFCGQCEDGTHPKRVIFDLVEGIPRPTSSTVATNTIRPPVEKRKTSRDPSPSALHSRCTFKDEKNNKNEANKGNSKLQKNVCYDSEGNARVDFYYFDHGNAQYFHTTDTPPVLKTEILAEKTERYTTRFWAEFFASIHVGVAFCVSFLLQLLKFLLYSVMRPLFVGVMQMSSDYFFKPFLTTFFNGLIQPLLIFLYNIATSMRDLCDPIAEAIGYFCREVAVLLKAIRLCTYKKNTSDDNANSDCNKKAKCEY